MQLHDLEGPSIVIFSTYVGYEHARVLSRRGDIPSSVSSGLVKDNEILRWSAGRGPDKLDL
jgi:hypothetical protein